MLNENIFKNTIWIKHWAGHFNVVYNTILGEHNTRVLRDAFGIDLTQALYIYKNGYTFAFFEERTYQKFGRATAEKLMAHPELVTVWSENFIKATDAILDFITKYIDTDITATLYRTYVTLFNDYSTWHRAVKVVVDFLPDDISQKYLPTFSRARVYAEPVYEQTEKFVFALTKRLAATTGYHYKHLLALSHPELAAYVSGGALPDEQKLARRSRAAAIIFKDGVYEIHTGQHAQLIEQQVGEKHEGGPVIKGTTAYPGIVTGTVRVIFNPEHVADFEEGSILVTGMTRPEFLYLMKKSAAFVTDAGGMLSHAAITARELKKPCVVGTEIATRILKDGDKIEVDATKGVIKKI